jgi:hypothetical protein
VRLSYTGWLRSLIIVLIILVLIGLVFVNYRLSMDVPGGDDFLARWNGANHWLVKGVNPYAEEVSLAAQRIYYGRAAAPAEGEMLGHFYYPLHAMLFFAPFGLLPFPTARTLWMTLLEIGLAVLVLVGTRLARWKPSALMPAILMIFAFLWYPSVGSLLDGQFAILEAVIMIGALLAIYQRHDRLAGVLLALSTVKPQMPVLLIPFVILWAASRRRLRLILWAVGSQIVLIGASLLLIPDWWIWWLRQLVDFAKFSPLSSPVAILAGVVPSASKTITAGLAIVFGLYLVWEWMLALRKHERWFRWTALITIVITNLITSRATTTDYVVLLPAWFLIFGEWNKRWGKKGTIGIVLTIILLTGGQWLLFLTTIQSNHESMIMHLPVPLLTLLGLWWIRWWTIQPQRMQH